MATTAQETNKRLVGEYHEVIERGDIDRIPEFFAAEMTVDLMEHDSGESEETAPEALAEEMRK
jgi:ketosteroid isomerase-like protein